MHEVCSPKKNKILARILFENISLEYKQPGRSNYQVEKQVNQHHKDRNSQIQYVGNPTRG